MAMIKFLCPNGHQLSAPEHLVGKAGKCPKCNTAFLVPSPDEPEEPMPEDAAEEEVVGAKSDSLKLGSDVLGTSQSNTANSASGSHSKIETDSIASGSRPHHVTDDVFVFLCPNGHKLNGPPSLKGKLGQCPHCQSRFRIPTDEEIEQFAQEEAESNASRAQLKPSSDSVALKGESSAGNSSTELPIQGSHLSSILKSKWKFKHELGEVLAQMWKAKGSMGDIEIDLAASEEKLRPDYYSPALSQGEFAVFGMSEGMNTNVLVIPWSSVVRCRITKVEQLPPGLFLD
jgi:Zn finger protein HypA/HybF involved in hydrogenase expression